MQKKIAITGGIGSGKSLASAIVAKMGYPVFSCDTINAELLQDSSYIEKIQRAFPDCVVDGKIDKSLLKSIVFYNEDALKTLNTIAHPMIMERLNTALNACQDKLVFAEVPLLFEEGYEEEFDEIIVILRDMHTRIDAVKKRDGLAEEEIKNRIAAQFDYATLAERIKNLSVHMIKNEGDATELERKLIEIVSLIKTHL